MAKASARWLRHGRAPAIGLALVVLVTGLVGLCARWVVAEDPPKPAAKKPAEVTTPAVNPGGTTAHEQVRVINEQIAGQWKENSITPSQRCSDFEFVRRASLDIIGRIATPQEVERFFKDPTPTRRALLIDRLLASEDYTRNWANLWTVWLMTRTGPGAYHEQMQDWLKDQLAKPSHGFDKIATDLLTATGENDQNGAVNYILAHVGEAVPGKPEEGKFDFVPITSRTTRLFLGVQTQCTQCHDHPFNQQWKQKHFWGMNAFFRQVERKGVPAMARNAPPSKLGLEDDPSLNRESKVFYEERRGVLRLTKAVFLEKDKNGNEIKWNPDAGMTRRQQLAQMVTTSPNFPRAYVNRMWGHFFGRGFTNPGPVDDFGDHNPITHPLPDNFPQIDDLKLYSEKPTLLDYLAHEFKRYGHNPRDVIRWICNSEAYNLSSVANKTNDKSETEPFFSRMLLKAMSPEQLFESLMVATQSSAADTKETKKELRERWMRNLIVNFGDDEGNEVTFNGTVVQALILMNGQDINDAISDADKGTVAMAIKKKGATTKTVMEQLYLAALNRFPTLEETKALNEEYTYIKTGKVKNKDVNALYQDVFWALLNSNEFFLNH